MINQRQIHLQHDKQLVLEFHCQTNYASDTPWARRTAYEEYREKWFQASQPEEFFAYFIETTQDPRTIAEFWVEAETGQIVGYIWVVYNEVQDYGLCIAEIMDVLVTPPFQGRGIGRQMLTSIEEQAIAHGANLIRSETGIENMSSRKLHETSGFYPYRVLFEKQLKHNLC